jgi:hypothetical protein
MTTPKTTWTDVQLLPRDHAHNIRAAARDYLTRSLPDVRPRMQSLSASNALYVASCYANYAALLELAELLDDDNVEAAARRAARLDSVQRDELPKPAWDFLAAAITALPRR